MEIQESLGKPVNLESLGKLDLNPHEAIRVTNIQCTDEIADQSAAKLYNLIRQHTIESCMAEYQANQYKITITAPQISTHTMQYTHILEIPIFMGWKKVSSKLKMNPSEDPHILTGQLFHLQMLVQSKKAIHPNYIESAVTIHNTHHYYTESGLIQKLEQLGIGRPSTYAQLVETIQDRGYVKCKDLDGITINCEEYKLINKILEKRIIERTFGKEKDKLIIQPIGILCIEFLITHFNSLFSYGYTKNMEDELDKITTQESSIALCERCTDEIQRLIKPVAKIEKKQYRIDSNHILVFNQYGPSIKRTIIQEPNDDLLVKKDLPVKKDLLVHEYLPVKKDLKLDLDKLKKGEYELIDLLEFENANLGKYENQDLFLRVGKYGNYVEWGENRKSIKEIQIPMKDITIKDIEKFLEPGPTQMEIDECKNKEYSRENHPSNSAIMRDLNKDYSIRKGKYGLYAYYKTPSMKTPKFYNLKGFPVVDMMTVEPQIIIDWIQRI